MRKNSKNEKVIRAMHFRNADGIFPADCTGSRGRGHHA